MGSSIGGVAGCRMDSYDNLQGNCRDIQQTHQQD
jgi:hypothetical protein